MSLPKPLLMPSKTRISFSPATGSESDASSAASGTATGAGASAKTRGKPARAARRPSAAPAPPAAEAAQRPAPQTTEPESGKAKQTAKPAGHDWVTLVDQLALSGQVRELARNVQLKARSDDRWEFVIAPALRHLGSDACVSRLSQAISDRMGHPVQVRIMEIKDSEPMTAAALERQQAHRNRSEAEKAIREDPTVRALQDQMGAQLVEDSIQPLQ